MVTQADRKAVAQEAASPPTIREALAVLAAAVRRELTGGEPLDTLEVTFGFAGRTGTIPVSFADANAADDEATGPDDDAATAKVLAAFGEFEDGSWVAGRTLAPAAELTYGGGQFNRAIKRLKASGQIVAHRVHGYKLNDS